MDRSLLKSNWGRFKRALQDYWDDLSSEEVDQINGDWDKLIHVLQKKYTFSRMEAEEDIQYFMVEVDEDAYKEIYNEKFIEESPY
jgi:hypothetical protein